MVTKNFVILYSVLGFLVLVGVALGVVFLLFKKGDKKPRGGIGAPKGLAFRTFGSAMGGEKGYGFSWNPVSANDIGYVVSYTYVIKDPSGKIVANVSSSDLTIAMIPLPYVSGTYSIAVAAQNQFGVGPYSFASGTVAPPEIVDFSIPWTDLPCTQPCGMPYWSVTFKMNPPQQNADVKISLILENGSPMLSNLGQQLKDIAVQKLPTTDPTWSVQIIPGLKPLVNGGSERGDAFTWQIVYSGTWGTSTFEKKDIIPGHAPSALENVKFVS